MMKLISDQIASRFVKPDNNRQPSKTLGVKRRQNNNKHLINRNSYQPWSINADDVIKLVPSRTFTTQQQSQSTSVSPTIENNQLLTSFLPNRSSANLNTPIAPLASDDECSGLHDPFEAADVVQLREMFRALNQDKSIFFNVYFNIINFTI